MKEKGWAAKEVLKKKKKNGQKKEKAQSRHEKGLLGAQKFFKNTEGHFCLLLFSIGCT